MMMTDCAVVADLSRCCCLDFLFFVAEKGQIGRSEEKSKKRDVKKLKG